MPGSHLEAPLFIKEIQELQVDIARTPYFFNDGGSPRFLDQPAANARLLTPAATDPAQAQGNEYAVAKVLGVKPTPPYGIETQLGFAAQEVAFAPLWATRDIAAAFGITLVEPGEMVQVRSPVAHLQCIEYEYGVFAGHWSPYQGTGNALLSVVCTDLEHHDFPHVFASTDPAQPLVISVGRYWPRLGRIRLADLWVPRGSALYIPPKPALDEPECIDLHNNRNSARACWGQLQQSSVVTHTLLQKNHGFFYWYWNSIATAHSTPVEIR
ncbi:MAG: hypothetical protein ACRC2X_13515 [Giesbergeria sp.]